MFSFDEEKLRIGNKGLCWVYSLNKDVAINLNVLYKLCIFICRAFSFPGSQRTLQTLISQQYLIVVWLLPMPPKWWNKNRGRLRNLPKATWGKLWTKTICCFCVCNNEQIKSAIIFFVIQKEISLLIVIPNYKKEVFLTSLNVYTFFQIVPNYGKLLHPLIVTARQLNIVMLTTKEWIVNGLNHQIIW